MVLARHQPLLSIPEERKEREQAQAAAREAAENQRVRTVVIPLIIFAVWQLLGALILISSAHAADVRLGQVFFTGGFAVGYGGAFFHLIAYYVRGRERDDW